MNLYELQNRKTIEGVVITHLNKQQRAFIFSWAYHDNLTWAAREAGYKHPNVAGSKLAANPKIAKVMKAVRKAVNKAAAVEMGDVLRKLSHSVNRNLHDLADLLGPDVLKIPPQCFAYIDSVKIKPIYDLVGNKKDGYEKVLIDKEIEIRMTPNATAMDMVMKHLGGYAPVQQEQTVTIKWDQFTAPPEDADSVEKEIEGVEYEVKKLDDRSSNELEDEAFG